MSHLTIFSQVAILVTWQVLLELIRFFPKKLRFLVTWQVATLVRPPCLRLGELEEGAASLDADPTVAGVATQGHPLQAAAAVVDVRPVIDVEVKNCLDMRNYEFRGIW